jgi:hypothetical protein
MREQIQRGHGSVSRRRRRTGSAEPLQKMTLQFDAAVAEAIRAVVKAGEAPSANVFVEQAVKARLRERRRERVYAAYAEAAQDPAFMAELAAMERAFDVTVGDGLS